jgi:sigma-B regulation protein RsbU (phosphoserine phosphatase)
MPLSAIFQRVNRYLSERSATERYATVFYGVLEKDGRFEYVNAGHVPPLLRRSTGEIEALNPASFPVGLFAEAEFQADHVVLQPGDFLTMYSDGVPEAANAEREFFEEDGLRRILADFKDGSVDQLAAAIREAIKAFTAGVPQADDITVLIFRYRGDCTSQAF